MTMANQAITVRKNPAMPITAVIKMAGMAQIRRRPTVNRLAGAVGAPRP
jgi:hypothetical protein